MPTKLGPAARTRRAARTIRSSADRERSIMLTNALRTGKTMLIPVAQLEYREGRNTLWIHGPNGATILRIKTSGSIKTVYGKRGGAQGDINCNDEIRICIP